MTEQLSMAEKYLDTMTLEQVTALSDATETVRAATLALDDAREARRGTIRRVAAEGITYRAIGTAGNIAYRDVAKIVSGHEPPTRAQHDHLEHECPRCHAEIGGPCEGKARHEAHIERHHLAIEAFNRQHPELG